MTVTSKRTSFSKTLPSAVLMTTLSLASPALLATNGYSPTGFGTINKGIAGAGVALPQDSMSAATNPAGMALVGHRIDTGIALFSPSNRGFTADNNGNPPFQIAPGEYSSDNDLFFIPLEQAVVSVEQCWCVDWRQRGHEYRIQHGGIQ